MSRTDHYVMPLDIPFQFDMSMLYMIFFLAYYKSNELSCYPDFIKIMEYFAKLVC